MMGRIRRGSLSCSRGRRQKSHTSQKPSGPHPQASCDRHRKITGIIQASKLTPGSLQYWGILSNQYWIKSQVPDSGTPTTSRGEGGAEQAAEQVVTELTASTVPPRPVQESRLLCCLEQAGLAHALLQVCGRAGALGTRRARSWKPELRKRPPGSASTLLPWKKHIILSALFDLSKEQGRGSSAGLREARMRDDG